MFAVKIQNEDKIKEYFVYNTGELREIKALQNIYSSFAIDLENHNVEINIIDTIRFIIIRN